MQEIVCGWEMLKAVIPSFTLFGDHSWVLVVDLCVNIICHYKVVNTNKHSLLVGFYECSF